MMQQFAVLFCNMLLEANVGTTIDEIIYSLKQGQGRRVENLVKMALDEGMTEQEIIEKGFLAGMEQISERFRRDEVGVPEILCVTRAMNQGIECLRSRAERTGKLEVGTVVLGTVNGELHDIGKNLVKMMLLSKNIRVIDLGANVAPSRFLEEVLASRARVLILSGILDSSVQDMRRIIELFEERGMRDQVYIMVGGYYLSEESARDIGADCYTENADMCARTAGEYLSKRRKSGRRNSRKSKK